MTKTSFDLTINITNTASALKKKEDGLKQIKEEYNNLKNKINIITEKQKKKRRRNKQV